MDRKSFLRNERAGPPPVPAASSHRDEAAQEVMGVVMLLAIFTIGVSLIWAVGFPALQGVQATVSLQRTMQAFTSLDSKISKAALGESPAQQIQFQLGAPSGGAPLSGGPLNLNRSSWMLVNLTDDDGNFVDCVNITLGSVVFSMENRSVAWEGGGVWISEPGGQSMLSPPEFHYDGQTMTLPAVNLSGTVGASGAGTVTLSVNSSNKPTVHYPTASGTNCKTGSTMNRPNPMTGRKVNVTVHSPYYQAWGRYMETLASTTVVYDGAGQNVTGRFQSPVVASPFGSAVYAADKVELKNSARIYSYNSANNQCSQASTLTNNQGSVDAASEIKLNTDATINGSANSSSKIELNTNAKVFGTCRGSPIDLGSGASCTGGTSGSIAISALPSVDGEISSKISTYSTTNDNAGVSCISANQISNPASSPCVINGPANIYLTKLDLGNNDELRIHTSGGIVNIAVAAGSTFKLNNDASIKLYGSSPVRFYLGSGINPDLRNGALLYVNGGGDNATASLRNTSLLQFWAYSGGSEWALDNSVNFSGVIYAPQKDLRVKNSARVCGALVGKKVTLDNNMAVNYDELLKGVQLFSADFAVVQYLHISENRLNITAS